MATKQKTTAETISQDDKAPEAVKAAPDTFNESVSEAAGVVSEEVEVKAAKQPTRLHAADHVRVIWSHTADVGETFEQMLNPATFAHVYQQLQVGHFIEIHSTDGSWFGTLYVRSVGRNEVYCGVINYVEFGAKVETSEDSPYAVTFRGPAMKWCVISRQSGEVIRPNFDTEARAGAWVAQHLKALAL